MAQSSNQKWQQLTLQSATPIASPGNISALLSNAQLSHSAASSLVGQLKTGLYRSPRLLPDVSAYWIDIWMQLPENAIMGFFFPFLRPLHCFVWKCNASSNVSLMSKFCERKRLAGEILEEKYPSNARGTVLAFSVFWALGPFVRVSVRAFGPNLLSKRELWKVSYLKGVHN